MCRPSGEFHLSSLGHHQDSHAAAEEPGGRSPEDPALLGGTGHASQAFSAGTRLALKTLLVRCHGHCQSQRCRCCHCHSGPRTHGQCQFERTAPRRRSRIRAVQSGRRQPSRPGNHRGFLGTHRNGTADRTEGGIPCPLQGTHGRLHGNHPQNGHSFCQLRTVQGLAQRLHSSGTIHHGDLHGRTHEWTHRSHLGRHARRSMQDSNAVAAPFLGRCHPTATSQVPKCLPDGLHHQQGRRHRRALQGSGAHHAPTGMQSGRQFHNV
mmetsp:Transcript_27356/g.48428  ORF Transcript_27356/g.48428 Transcript_27356/m.48428 type:complete len:265 (-) Transcript_27356:450-1244(-)